MYSPPPPDDRHCVLPGMMRNRKMRARATAWIVHIEFAKAIVDFIKRAVSSRDY